MVAVSVGSGAAIAASRRHAVEQGLEQLQGVPGRFEIVSTRGDEVTVIVDYAHTDDALRNLLSYGLRNF